jgi:cytochrome o ubiquinol oxidase subunit IV
VSHNNKQTMHLDYGTGEKKLSTYLIGLSICVVLTLLAFWSVMHPMFDRMNTFIVIYSLACIQFVVQLIFFLRLNTTTPQGKNNVMALIFTIIILICVVFGSLWIMYNLAYNMIH